jgi:alpha-mannosidase
LLVSFKIADDGAGYVMRLLEFSGKPTRADIRFGPLTVSRVVPVDAVEGERATVGGEEARVDGGGVTVSLRPFELKTLRIFFGG